MTFNMAHKANNYNEAREKSVSEETGSHLPSKSNQGTSASILCSIETCCWY